MRVAARYILVGSLTIVIVLGVVNGVLAQSPSIASDGSRHGRQHDRPSFAAFDIEAAVP